MKYFYYPGCTLYSKAKNFDNSARNCAMALGIELTELPDWTCCGTVFPLVTDNLMTLVSPVRNLANAKKGKQDMLLLCAFCYNVFKRTNESIKNNLESQKKINDFLREDVEEPYKGDVKVLHMLEVLRDIIGFEKLKDLVKKKLDGLRLAPYYGCMLLRPEEVIKLDDQEQPKILGDLCNSLGAIVIDFPYKTECCSSYLTISSPEVTVDCSYSILNSAQRNGAEAIVLSCPLCFYNLDSRQKEIREKYTEFSSMPIVYFTEILGLALGLKKEECGLGDHYIDPVPLLKDKGIIVKHQ